MTGVIVADNDMLIRCLLRSSLEGAGQTVILASRGEETIAVASEVRATLIMLDLNAQAERLREIAPLVGST